MPPTKHALLSASASHRWLNCTPSARLELEFEDQETEAAAEGTAAHALCEHKLRRALKLRARRKPISKYDSDEMDMHTDNYVQFVLEALAEARQHCADPVIHIEQRLDFSCYVPDGFGTGDCVIVGDKTLHIIDFKYGQGVLVEAERNPQMMLYALGALRIFDSLYDIEDVSMTIPYEGGKFIVADFSAIEARVIAWMAGEQWRLDVFSQGGDIYCASASQMFHVPVVKHGINGHLRQKGKIAELALGYGGSVGALKAMGALEMGIPEEELKPLVDAWRDSNPHITQLWWDVDDAIKETVKEKVPTETHGLQFLYESGFLFMCLPSGRRLAYVKPRIGENKFGGESVTYEGIGPTKKWERLESYGPKFVENAIQAISRDVLCYAMKTLRCCNIVAHVHDELIIEADPHVSLDAICEQMGRTPPWAKGLILRADGYETPFYKKD